MTAPLAFDASPGDVEAALLALDNLRAGDVAASSGGGTAGAGFCTGETVAVTFTMPTGNQPPLVAVSSLLEGGLPGGAIDVRTNDGTKERDFCNAAGFCDADGLITIDIENVDEAPRTNGTCDCDLGWSFDADFGACGRPDYNTSAWTGLQRCAGFVTKDTAHDPVNFMNWRWLYVADAMNVTAAEVTPPLDEYGNATGMSVFQPGMYHVGPLEPNEEDVPLTFQLWNMTNTSVAGVALDLSWRELYYVDLTIAGVRAVPIANDSAVDAESPTRRAQTEVVRGLSETLDGVALNLLFGERSMYLTDPGADGVADGQIYLVDLEDRDAPSDARRRR